MELQLERWQRFPGQAGTRNAEENLLWLTLQNFNQIWIQLPATLLTEQGGLQNLRVAADQDKHSASSFLRAPS